MSEQDNCTVIAYIRPKEGAENRLLSLRAQMMDEFRTTYKGFVSGSLYRVDGSDEWRDVVVFTDRTGIDTSSESAAYKEWASLVDLIKYEILEPISGH